ncbi:MAG: trypsin-like peptidase domain-containing protein [Acidobacteriota bacterium]
MATAKTAKLGVSVLCAALLFASSTSSGQSPDRKAITTGEGRERIRHAIATVGLIMVRKASDADQQLRPRGSAVIVRSDGIIVTNYHVIAEDKTDRFYDEIYFRLPAQPGEPPQLSTPHRLEVALANKSYDLALLRVLQRETAPLLFPAIEIGDSRAVKLLDDLIVIGFPEAGGSTVTVNLGVVEGTDLLANWVKTNARLIHGNSGGAAVNSEGKLIGIPTKVLADRQAIDRDGDGFPDAYQALGAVGFLRPSHLVAGMLAKLPDTETKKTPVAVKEEDQTPVKVGGIIRSAIDGKPIAGARIGLTVLGSREASPSNLLSWGGTNSEGQFTLNKPVPPGRYTLKARAISYEIFSLDMEINQRTAQLIIKLRPLQ